MTAVLQRVFRPSPGCITCVHEFSFWCFLCGYTHIRAAFGEASCAELHCHMLAVHPSYQANSMQVPQIGGMSILYWRFILHVTPFTLIGLSWFHWYHTAMYSKVCTPGVSQSSLAKLWWTSPMNCPPSFGGESWSSVTHQGLQAQLQGHNDPMRRQLVT